MGEGPVTGTTLPIGGNTVALWNREKYITCWSPEGECGAACWCLDCAEECVLILDDDGEIVDYLWYLLGSPDIAECRTTPEGEVQACYQDTWSGEAPGSVGPLVASGCSRAEQWFFYTECCLIDS